MQVNQISMSPLIMAELKARIKKLPPPFDKFIELEGFAGQNDLVFRYFPQGDKAEVKAKMTDIDQGIALTFVEDPLGFFYKKSIN